MAHHEFFMRIEGFDMKPGSKQAGFVVVLDGAAAVTLRSIKPTQEHVDALARMVSERLAHADVVSKAMQASCRVILADESAFPKVIMTSGIGGSIGMDGQQVMRLAEPDAQEWVGPIVELTPHNVDTPKEALALMVMVHAWAEWAYTQLLLADFRAKQAQTQDGKTSGA